MNRLRLLVVPSVILLACSSSGVPTPEDGTDAAIDVPPDSGDDGLVALDGSDTLDAAPRTVIDPGVVSAATGSQHEPTVAASISGHVGVAWIELKSATISIGYRLSNDGGKSWDDIGNIPPPAGAGFLNGDPIMAADDAGTLHLAWGSVKKNSAGERLEGHLWLAKAAPGASMFEAPVEITDPASGVLFDQPRIAVTKSGTLVYTYMTYPLDSSTSAIVVATSKDGATWTKTTLMEDTTFRNLAFPCVAQTGKKVWVKYLDLKLGIVVRSSDDDGATWPESKKLVANLSTERAVAFVTPGCAARGDEAWILYGISKHAGGGEGGDSDVLKALRLAHTSDGATIDSRIDLDTGSGAIMFPEIVAEPDGALDVSYYGGVDAPDPAAALRWLRSTDGGRTFGPSEIAHAPIMLDPARTKPLWLGDYMGLAFAGHDLYFAYIDNATGTGHAAFYRTSVP
jgi:hypothetical protein